MNISSNNLSILIVGAGPTGLMLGCQLLQQGIACRMIERRSKRDQATRAIGVTGSTLKLFSELGILKDFLEASIVTQKIQFYWDGKPYLSLKTSSKKEDEYGQFIYSTQPTIEAVLEKKFLELGGKIEWKTELTELQAFYENNQVTLVKENQSCQEIFDYVIGCDGGHSIVRSKMKVEYARENYHSFFCLADVELVSGIEGNHAHYFLTKQGYCMLIPIPENKYRIIFSVLGEYSPGFHEQMDSSLFESLFLIRANKNLKIKTIIWKTSGPFRHQVVLTPVENRLILAGDSLHVFSPIGGTNMNFGLLDAEKLANCFAGIAIGKDPELVLNHYAQNRQNFMQKNMEVTQAATYLITRSPQRDIEYENKFKPSRENYYFIREILLKQFSLQNYY
jgi:2-polyprenyl-6-methoxyphenol hydroxylase-like FAD-dependent oxidoreductase